jgi:uncharacterized membrane protein YccC
MSAWTNAFGLAVCVLAGTVLCAVLVTEASPRYSGLVVGACVAGLYFVGMFVGRRDERRWMRIRWDEASRFDRGSIITLSDGSRMVVVETAPPESDE